MLDEIAGAGWASSTAREAAPDRDVAIKVLQDRYPPPDSRTAKRFLHESRITAQLQHPPIPPTHHVGRLPAGGRSAP